MASIASTPALTVSTTASIHDLSPQAGPLPSKSGEIGYREDLHGQDLERGIVEGESRSDVVVTPLPSRHPADRDATEAPGEAHADIPLTPAAAVAAPASQTAEPPRDSSSTHSTNKKSILGFLTGKGKKIPTVGGIRLTTLFLFITQFLLIGGTVVGWVLAIRRMNQNTKKANSNDPNGTGIGSGSTIFIHVLFGVFLLAELLLLERRVFRVRAERYAHVHPGEVLPSSRRLSTTRMGITPWQRPPLPTYAAA